MYFSGSKSRYLLTILVLLIGSLILAACGSDTGDGGENPGDMPGLSPRPGEELGMPAMGSPDAPITMVEFGDFGCPYCGVFALQVKPEIIEHYVETGIVRFIWRDFPVITENSLPAARAARCAQEQGAFWEYHDALYEVLDEDGSRAFDDAKFSNLAKDLSLDTARFDGCLEDNPHQSVIARDIQHARQLGARATPTFLVNGYLVSGSQPFEQWEEIFAELLADGDGDD